MTFGLKKIEINQKDRLYIGAKFDALIQDMQRNHIDLATMMYESVAFAENMILAGKPPQYSPEAWVRLALKSKEDFRASFTRTMAELKQAMEDGRDEKR